MTVAHDTAFGPWRRGVPDRERAVQLAELRALVFVLCGHGHPLVKALRAAEGGDEAVLAAALAQLDGLPSLNRRRVLATFNALRTNGKVS